MPRGGPLCQMAGGAMRISAEWLPVGACGVRENAWGLARRYARTVQDEGLVPIVEPES